MGNFPICKFNKNIYIYIYIYRRNQLISNHICVVWRISQDETWCFEWLHWEFYTKIQIVFRNMLETQRLIYFPPCRHRHYKHCRVFNLIWGHHTYTPPPGLGLEKMRRWLVYTMSWYICKRKTQQILCTPPRGRAAPPWWCIYKLENLGQFAHTPRNGIHHPFSDFSRPKPGCGVYIYIWCPHRKMPGINRT